MKEATVIAGRSARQKERRDDIQRDTDQMPGQI